MTRFIGAAMILALASAPAGARDADALVIERRLQSKYFWEAMRDGEQGDLVVRIMVDATGAIQACHVDEAMRIKHIKSKVCAEFERGIEFWPALEADGQPMDTFYTTRLLYRLY